MSHQGYGFCEFLSEEDAEYACKIMNQIKLYGKPIRVNKASSDKKQLDVGANLFIGNLDENVDERVLYDTFSVFGVMADTAKIARDPGSSMSKGYGFVSYTDFESADASIEAMNGQFLMNKAISVQYAFKKDGKGERHGTPAERLLAAQARKNNALPMGSRPPPAPIAFGGRPAPPGQAAQYMTGQYAGALSQAIPPPPPPGFAQAMPGMAPPPPPAPAGMGGYPMPGTSAFMPPPPPVGFPGGMPPMMGMMGMHPPPPPAFATGANAL